MRDNETHEVTGEFSEVDPDYLSLFTELHHELNVSKNKTRNNLFRIDVEKTRQLLEELGFRAQPTVTFRRYVYEVSEQPKMWLRLRTDGSKTTLTLKKFETDTIDGMKELEFKLDDFETANKLVTVLGFTNSKYQENRRTNYVSETYDAEISIDEWPKIPTYLEIEAKSEAIVQDLLKKINDNGLPTTSHPTDAVYKRYGLDINSYPELSF